MNDVAHVPYEQGLIKSDYVINPDIEAFDLTGSPINPTLLSHAFKLGSWAVLQVVPILLIFFKL